ncbi:hypothetical protein HPB50_001520 [Hyalomma asiaticum]|uniref:Uncharacterized protein n=1 Tax=Hyalomma asiaticum TaxID=266040 RepID=A0ACB7SLM0_HYAAI|nr:hypothetical protein HPB50_001520 [Hyalomma asiaticum]
MYLQLTTLRGFKSPHHAVVSGELRGPAAMSRNLFSAQALWSCVCLTVLVGSLLADAELDCRKYPFYYKCRGISAKRSYVPYSKAEPVSLKELYNDEDEPKNRQKTPEAVLAWIRDRYGDEMLDSYDRRQITEGSFERKPVF